MPAVNLGNTSFLDGRAGPGSLLQLTGAHYHGSSLRDSSGNSLPGHNRIDVDAVVLQYAYITKKRLLGGYYGAEVLLPAVDIDPDTTLPGLPRRAESGLSDLIVSPFMLQWTGHLQPLLCGNSVAYPEALRQHPRASSVEWEEPRPQLPAQCP